MPKSARQKSVTERTASIPTWGQMSPITVMAVATDFHRDFLFDTRRVLSSTRDRPFLILFCSVMHGFSVQQYCIIAPWLCQRGDVIRDKIFPMREICFSFRRHLKRTSACAILIQQRNFEISTVRYRLDILKNFSDERKRL